MHFYGLVFLSRNYWSLLDHALMASIWEKAISVLAGKLNSGRSYLITAIYYKYSITIWVFIVWVWISSIITLSLILFFGKIVQKNQLELITFNSWNPFSPLWSKGKIIFLCGILYCNIFQNLSLDSLYSEKERTFIRTINHIGWNKKAFNSYWWYGCLK